MDKENSRFKGQINTVVSEKKLDLINKKILYILSLNARFGYNTIAKTLNIKREVVNYRIKKLEEENFLEGFFSHIDVTKIGYQMYLLYLKLYNTKNYKALLQKFNENKKITRIKEVTGAYDLQLVLTTKKVLEADQIIDQIINDFGENIKTYAILRIVEEGFTGLQLLLSEDEIKKIKIKEPKGSSFQNEFINRKEQEEQIIIDDKDRQILKILHLNARESIKNISDKINLAPIAVENRIKKLISNGVIKSMYPLFNIGQLGYQWHKVLLQVKNINKTHFLEYLKTHSNILWYMKIIGTWNYQVSVFAKNTAEFHQIMDDIRNKFSDNIIAYESLIVLNQQKFVHDLD